MRRLTLAITVLFCSGSALGQTLDQVRRDISRSLQESRFALPLKTLVDASTELTLGGARFDFDDGTEVRTFVLPYARTHDVLGEDRPGLYTEASLGVAVESVDVDDIYAGALPSLVTSVDSTSTVVSLLAGVGPSFTLAEGLTLTPLVVADAASIENDAEYAGPGANATAALLDGIALNWSALTLGGGVAARLEWTRPLPRELEFRAIGRYDSRWIETVRTDDPAQEFSARSQFATLRADLTGPTGLALADATLRWRLFAGYKRFLEGDLYATRGFGEGGAGLELNGMPWGGSINGRVGIVFGDGVEGVLFGAGITF